MTAAPTTAERLSAVMADMSAVGKDRKADQQMGGYSFRGIEDVANAVHPILAANGLTLVAETLEHTVAYRQFTSGNGRSRERRDALVHVRYSVRGPSGELVILGSWWGEGDAFDDKATNKAYSAAMKLCLLQAFVIPTQDLVDTESSVNPDAGEPTTETTVQLADADTVARVKELAGALTEEGAAKWKASKVAKLYAEEWKAKALTAEVAADAVRWLEQHGLYPEPAAEEPPEGVDAETGEVNPVAAARAAAKTPDALEIDPEPF